MMKRFLALVIFSALTPFASAQSSLDGTYERVSLTNIRTGNLPKPPIEKGYLFCPMVIIR